MKKINIGFAADPTPQQPFTVYSLDFIQKGIQEQVLPLARHLIQLAGLSYSSSVPYLICPDVSPFDSYILFGGELYHANENVSSLQYALIDTTPDSVADPLTFTDNVARNVHNNRYLTYSASATGALFDVNNIVNIYANNYKGVTLGSGWTALSGATPGYLKVRDRFFFKGGITASSGSGTLFTITDAADRPSITRVIPCSTFNGTTTIANALRISTSGVAILDNVAGGPPVSVYLDGLNYSL